MPINVDRYEELAGDVLKLYEDAERTMMRRVARRLNRGINQRGWAEKKYGEMREVSREMTRYVDSLSKHRGDMQQRAIEQAYADAREAMISDARTFTELSGIQGLTPNTVKVLNIMSELNSTMDAADRRILRSVNDAYADIVGRSSAMVATGSITYREAVKQELEDFANRGITSFVDRAGRSWDMETYAEMATLTAIERATREGYTDTMREFEYDLAQISDHYGACPICEAWQGVIISVRGETRGYPTLDEAMAAGVFHPRCMHDFSVYYEGISPPGRKNPLGELAPSAGYSVRAKQRSYERQIRKWKRRMAVAQTPEEERAAYARVRMYQDRVRSLVDEYNAITDPSVDHLPRKYWREGGKTKLSEAAKKLKPVAIPEVKATQPSAKSDNDKELNLFRSALQGASNAAEFWMNMDAKQMDAFMASGENIYDLYNRLHDKASPEMLAIPEWKPSAAGGAVNYQITFDYSASVIKVNAIPARSEGWMAGAETTGLINVRKGGIDDWKYVIGHEAGHQLANYNPELQRIIIDNPGGLLGRYNQKHGYFDGVFGEYNAEEAWADAVSSYVNSPQRFQEQYPELYRAVDGFFKSTPSARDFIDRAYAAYRKATKI